MFRKEEALEICQEFIEKHQLKLDILGARVEEEQIVFLFHSPKRVDFKSLATDLYRVLQMPVRFEPVDARTKARLIGGIGKCGRRFCCTQWLGEIPEKCLKTINGKNGICGRARCCLLFEEGENWLENKIPKQEDTETVGYKDAKIPKQGGTGIPKYKDTKIQKGKDAKIKKKKPRKKRVRRLKI